MSPPIIPVPTRAGNLHYLSRRRCEWRPHSAAHRIHPIKAGLGAGLAALAVALIVAVLLLREPAWPEIHSLAILPFTNETDDAEFDYLGVGLPRKIAHRLSRLPKLTVTRAPSDATIQHSASLSQRDRKELVVDAIVTGQLSRRGEDLVISVSLKHVADNRQLWSENHTCQSTGIVDATSQLLQDLATKLDRKLSVDELERIVRRDTNSDEARLLFEQGRYYVNQYTKDGLEKGIGTC
jgi:TolB-like protein